MLPGPSGLLCPPSLPGLPGLGRPHRVTNSGDGDGVPRTSQK